MKIYRYMSAAEKDKLLAGQTINNTTDHKALGVKSTSIGFTFGIGNVEQAKKDFKRLCGIVTPEYLLVGKLKPGVKLNKCKGLYVDYEGFSKLSEIEQLLIPIGQEPRKYYDELCTTAYSTAAFDTYDIYLVVNPYSRHPDFILQYRNLQGIDFHKEEDEQ